MKPRLENAITKLYTAFHEGTLDAYSPCYCAVGNLLGGAIWTRDGLGTKITMLKGCLNTSGYSGMELAKIEVIFIESDCTHCELPKKENQFLGLCEVVAYLCKLDNEPNVMDIQKLFEFDENKKPVHELQFS